MTACTVKGTSPYPVYEIDLSQLNAPIEISAILKDLGTEKYTYTFEYQGQVIKHGISADQNSIYGERIYRQAGHLEGWSKQLAPGSAGNEMRDVADRYFAKNGKSLNRQGMKIVVRDLTNVESPSITDDNLHIKQLERQLIKEYEEKHNELPIGNIKDESYIDNRTCVSKTTWDNLFELE